VQSNTTVSIPYQYTLDGASCVPNVVSQTAGANKGLQVSNGNCVPQTPTTPPTTAAPNPTTPGPTTPAPTTPAPTQPSGTNLSIGAGSDGSSKADGTSYGNVRDANMSTYWSPVGSTGYISIKWGSPRTVSRINIREAAGSVGAIGSWRVINADTGAILASGNQAGVITFAQTTLSKITFDITSSTATPRVAEYETYAG
jgi:pectate lyase